MFGGGDSQFNPDLLSDRLEDMLPVIQQVCLLFYLSYNTILELILSNINNYTFLDLDPICSF